MKVNDIVVLKEARNEDREILLKEKHLFKVVDKLGYAFKIKSLTTDIELETHHSHIRLATLKERYLVNGNSVIFDNKEYYVAGKRLIGRDNYMMLKDIDDNLKFYNGVDKINKVIELHEHKLEGYIIWKRGIELTDDEKVILKNVDKDYNYIMRTENNLLVSKSMFFSKYPDTMTMSAYNHLFKNITTESGIHEIKELLK